MKAKDHTSYNIFHPERFDSCLFDTISMQEAFNRISLAVKEEERNLPRYRDRLPGLRYALNILADIGDVI